MSATGVQVVLSNRALWEKFPAPMEMIVIRRSGRKMFPVLEYDVKGLDESKLYEVYLHMERVDGFRYKYTDHWVGFAEGDPIESIQRVKHRSGGQLGRHWMSKPISFDQARLTNDQDTKKTDIFRVQSMHKWRPVLTIEELADGSGQGSGEEFRVDGTEFMAVTSYQNPDITKVKVDTNKMASGHRKLKRQNSDHEAPPTKRFCQSSPQSTAPSNVYPTPPATASPPTASPPTTWTPQFYDQMLPMTSTSAAFYGVNGSCGAGDGAQGSGTYDFRESPYGAHRSGAFDFGASQFGAQDPTVPMTPFDPMWPQMDPMYHTNHEPYHHMPQHPMANHMGTMNPWSMGKTSTGNFDPTPYTNYDFCR